MRYKDASVDAPRSKRAIAVKLSPRFRRTP
jgi:hypothetical protein